MQLLLVAALVLVVAAVILLVVHGRAREGFSLGNIFGKIVNGVKKGIDATVNGVKKGVDVVKGVVGKGGTSGYNPSFVGRQHNGSEWQCPDNTVDTGREDYQACLASEYMNPLWRWDGKTWGWSCPFGTVPTAESQWERKCVGPWITRVNVGGKYQCPPGTWDSGADWSNTDWHSAHKQCRLSSAYTQRIWDGKKWVCPPNSTDTKRNWGQPNGDKQCKWKTG